MRPERSRLRLDDPDQAAHLIASRISSAPSSKPSVLLIAGDRDACPMQHLEIVDCAPDPSPSECALVLTNVLEILLLDAAPPIAGVLLGLVRPGGDRILAFDRAWFRAQHRTCHSAGLAPWGVYVFSEHGVRVVTMDDAA